MLKTPLNAPKPGQAEDTPVDVDVQKKLLEVEKLRIEIKQEARHPFARFSTYPPLMTFIIAMIGGYATFNSGILNAKRIQLQTHAIKTQKENLEVEKEKLAKETLSLNQELDKLANERKKLINDTSRLHRQFDKLRSSFEQNQKTLLQQKSRTRSVLKTEILDFASRIRKEYAEAENKDELVRKTYEKEQKKLNNSKNNMAAAVYNKRMDSLTAKYVTNAPDYKGDVTSQFDIVDFATAKFYRDELIQELPNYDHKKYDHLYSSPPDTEPLVKAVLDNLETLAKAL